MVGTDSVKSRNVPANASITLHRQVTKAGDGVELRGKASVHDDVERKRRLWDVFDTE